MSGFVLSDDWPVYVLYCFEKTNKDPFVFVVSQRCDGATVAASWTRSASWWRHQMETFSASLALCVGNSPVHRWIPLTKASMWNFHVYFDLCLNKRLSKQTRHHRAHYDVIVMMEDNDPYFLQSQYHCYWWPGDVRGHGINRHGIVGCRYNAVHYIIIFYTVQKCLMQDMNQSLYSQKTPNISPSRASNGVSLVRSFETIDRVITAPYCIHLVLEYSDWSTSIYSYVLDTLREIPTHRGRDKLAPIFPTRHFQMHFLEWKFYALTQISLKFVPKGPIDNIRALADMMAWHRTGNTPLTQSIMMTS